MPIAGGLAAVRLLLRRSKGRRTDLVLRAVWKSVRTGQLLIVIGTTALLALMVALAIRETAVAIWMLLFSPVMSTLLVIFASAGLGLLGMIATMGELAVRALLWQKKCPGCGYELGGVPRERVKRAHGGGGSVAGGDEIVRCPECGSVWRAERLGREREPAVEVVVSYK